MILQSRSPASYCRLNHNVPILRLWFDVEAELKQEFRLSRRTLQGLQRLLHRDQDHGWGNQLEVLIYAYWLAHGLSYRYVSRVFGVPRSTVHRIIHKVAQNIWLHLNRAIRFPRAQELQEAGRRFAELSGSVAFSSVAGVVDSTHIRIKAPPQHRRDYLNQGGFCSLNMQVICGPDGRFWDIFVGYPGSVPEVQVLRSSSFYRARRYPPPGLVLLGGAGYPCLDSPVCLVTPYQEPGPLQERFNQQLCRVRSVSRGAFALMKTRWRSTLCRSLEVKATFAPQVISSCAFLHNVCLDHQDTLDIDHHLSLDLLDPPPGAEPLAEGESPGGPTRDRLAGLTSFPVPLRE